jgi:hypothetical protein
MGILPNLWTDDELLSILDETSTWIINGNQDLVLCFSLSLRAALERAADFARSGATVYKICRQPGDNIVVMGPQVVHLIKVVTGRVRAAVEAPDGLST